LLEAADLRWPGIIILEMKANAKKKIPSLVLSKFAGVREALD
jgi:hypothetical protein